MNTLLDRINAVINTDAFEDRLDRSGIDMIDFQLDCHRLRDWSFDKLPLVYQEAILEGERELASK